MKNNTLSRSTHIYLGAALLIAAIFALIVQLPVLQDPNAVEEDFRTLFWVHRYQDPTLFSRVPFDKLGVTDVQIGSLTLVLEEGSPGYSLLLQSASYFVSPALFIKLLIFPLLLTAVYYIFRIGLHLTDRRTAFALSATYIVLNLASFTEISVTAGLHRSFVTPLLLSLLYYLLIRHYQKAAVVVFLSGFIYLPIFPVCTITYFLSIINLKENNEWRPRVQGKPFVYLIAAVLLVAIAISPIIVRNIQRILTPPITASGEPKPHILQDPEFQPGGRRPIFRLFPVVGRGGIVTGNIDAVHLLFLGLLALSIILIRRGKTQTLPAPFKNLLLASFIGFTLAWSGIIFTSSFLFYIPSRHTQSSLFLLLIIFNVVNFKPALRRSFQWIINHRRQIVWYSIPVTLLALIAAVLLPSPESEIGSGLRSREIRVMLAALGLILLALAIVATRKEQPAQIDAQEITLDKLKWVGILFLILSPAYILFIKSFNDSFYFPSTSEEALFAFVETLPEDSLIGGDPCALNNIPFYAKRAVLFSCERYKFLDSPETVRAMLDAYYADTRQEVNQFCTNYDVNYLIVDESKFDPDFIAGEEYFYAPYDEWLAEKIKDRSQFALNNITNQEKLFQVDSRFVTPCPLPDRP
jgi:hypothetical protein